MIDFDDQSGRHGFYVGVIRLVDRVRGRQRDWHRSRSGLGESLLSALCAERFEAVHDQVGDGRS